MAVPLQKTKLFIPPARERLVERPRLLERLDHLLADGCRAALISAPAGSGKTTLLVQWLSRQAIPAGWLSLDPRDNTPSRFFAYLIAALQTVVLGAGNEALPLLDLPAVNPEEILTLLTNDLAEAAGSFLLILDDFHSITNPALRQTVDLLIDAQPPQMRLVLLSREDPAVSLARRRARGQLLELRQVDLRFSLAEALAFLNQTMRLNLTTDQAEALEARTEGWIAGLQMAALALQARPVDVERWLHEFSGSQRFILDYLMEEVLSHQSAPVQRFLLETAVLERLSASLCAAVTGRTVFEAQEMLDTLSKTNLFLIPLDDERHWYRYHHLFHELLMVRLQGEGPARTAVLYERASDWYEANREPRLAVANALSAGNDERAADLIEQHIAEHWQMVDLEFQLLIHRLPESVIQERPLLCLQKAWLCVLFGQAEQIPSLVETAERALAVQDSVEDVAKRQASRAFARTLRAYVLDLANQPIELDETLPLALSAIPAENVGMRNSVAVVIGTVYFMEGELDAAQRCFEEALALDMQTSGTNAVPIATTRIAWVLQVRGQLREAMRRLQQAETYVRQHGIRRFYISGVLHLVQGEILMEWNQLDEAEARMREGLHLLEDWPVPQIRCLGWSLMARLHLVRGERAEAAKAVEAAEAILQQHRLHPLFLDAVNRARVRLWIAEQDRSALSGWARENEPSRALCFRDEARQIELCRAWLALGRTEEAAGLLGRLAEAVRDRHGSRVAVLTLLAAARSQEPAAPDILNEALHLAEPDGYMRTLLETGQSLCRALDGWFERHQVDDNPRIYAYARQIRAAFGDGFPVINAPGQQPGVLPETLSAREQEVLQLVAQGLTNQQIADRLVISVRTVKKHIENIHGKLGVQNRTQAAVLARELGLLD